MIKYVIIFIQLIGLSIYQLFFGNVTATQKIPDKINAGEEVTVEITINKEDINGFAKVQQTLPIGFNAEVIESKGATFSFKENTVKFIWMALPTDKQFVISYKLKTTTEITGDFKIGGKFSFISDNERKNVDIPESSISIVKGETLASQQTPQNQTETTEQAVENNSTEEPITQNTNQPTSTDKKVSINAVRKIEQLGDKYKISLTIKQTNLEGFAKYSDVIPSGFKAVADNSEGGIFSFNEGEAKILWMSTPKKEEFTVSYFIESSGAQTGKYDINGTFSYLENDITQNQIINSSTIDYKATTTELTAENTTKIEQPEPIKKTEPITKTETQKQPTETKTVSTAVSTPSPEKGVTYKVQIGAGHKQVSKNYFNSKFNVSESVSIENHEGWIKYIVGKFTEYKTARDKRNEIRNNVKTAFVTAYNQGSRITVQEALMISNQKWLQ